ncbi:MAG TPA: chemotaxis protein CheW [Streptosporangiaceae bacterium]|nr:chemotaxis protein CheW [Streptosporangiaceae bacterium]
MAVYLRFDVADEIYAVPIANVIEVAVLGQVVAIPRAPAQILGVQLMHGFILPVVDLAAVLRLERSTPAARLLVAAVGDLGVGFAVDDVAGVTELPEVTEEAESPVLRGAVLADGTLIGIIDVARAVEWAATSAGQAALTDSMRAVLP